MEDLAIIITLDHLGSFRKHFGNTKEKNKNAINQPRSLCIGKPVLSACSLGWYLRPWAQFFL